MKLVEVIGKDCLLELAKHQLGFEADFSKCDIMYLIDLGIVKKDYATNKLIVDIFKDFAEPVDEDELERYVEVFRNKFAEYPNLKGNKGNKGKIYERLEWFMLETGFTIDEIDQATDIYIQECVQQNRFLLDPHYFIWKSETSRKRTLIDSRLYSVCEDMQDGHSESYTSYEL